MQTLHATDIRHYLDCRRAFKYGIIERLKYDGHQKPAYFEFGTEGHKVLAGHYRQEDTTPIIEAIENIEDRQKIKLLYSLYAEEYKEADKGLQIAAVENTIRFEWEGFPFEFTMDLVALNTDVKPKPIYEIYDHKFYKTFPMAQVLDFDFQVTFYIWAARKFGLKINRMIYNVIRKSVPEYPQVLVKGDRAGKLSNSNTTLANTELAMYKWAIEQLGQPESLYREELDHLAKRGNNFLRRYPLYRTENELQSFELDLKKMLDEIHSSKDPDRDFYPTPGLHCSNCQFAFLCKVQNNQGNVEGTKKSMYVKKEEGER